MSDLVGNTEDRFSHNEAHVVNGLTVNALTLTAAHTGPDFLQTVTDDIALWEVANFYNLMRQ